MSLRAFLLLGFWISGGYSRYWRNLRLWKTCIQPKLQHLAFFFVTTFREGRFHQRDREKLLSYLVVPPYEAKVHLR